MTHTEFYDRLGVSPSCTLSEIKKSYKKKAMKFHPDRPTGDEIKFKNVLEAYETLSDPVKRERYNRFGSTAGGGGGGPSPFTSAGFPFFNLSDIFQQSSQKMKPKNLFFTLRVTLEELYLGCQREVSIRVKNICEICKGKGGRNTRQCSTCEGTGSRFLLKQLKPGMFQRTTQPCHECFETGRTCNVNDVCAECKGKQMVSKMKTFSVDIPAGSKENQQFLFRGQGDVVKPGNHPGDVVVKIQTIHHPVFTREGDDLRLTKHISLSQSLLGVHFVINHLDKRKISIQSQQNHCTASHSVWKISQEGMVSQTGGGKGDLVVQIIVDFPRVLPAHERCALENIFKSNPQPRPENDFSREVILTEQVEKEEKSEPSSPSGKTEECSIQ